MGAWGPTRIRQVKGGQGFAFVEGVGLGPSVAAAAVDADLLRQIVAEQIASLQIGKGAGKGGGLVCEVWVCKRGEKNNWARRLNCRVCGLGRPDGLIAAAVPASSPNGDGTGRGAGSAPLSPASLGRLQPAAAGAPGPKQRRALSTAVHAGQGMQVNLEDENEDQLFLQLAESKKAKAAVLDAERQVEEAKKAVAEFKQSLKKAHAERTQKEDALKRAQASLCRGQGRLRSAKLRGLATSGAQTPRSSAAWGANLGRGRGRRLAAGALGLPRQVRRQAAGVEEEEEEEPLGADMERAELSPTQPWERPASQRSGAGSGEGAAASDTGGGATVAAAAALDPASLLDPVEGMGAGAVFVGPVAGGPSLRESAERASQERFKRPSTVASRRTSRRGPAASVISLDLPPARAKTARGRPTGRPKGLAKSQKQRKLEQRAAAAAASAGSSLSIIGLPRGRRVRGAAVSLLGELGTSCVSLPRPAEFGPRVGRRPREVPLAGAGGSWGTRFGRLY